MCEFHRTVNDSHDNLAVTAGNLVPYVLYACVLACNSLLCNQFVSCVDMVPLVFEIGVSERKSVNRRHFFGEGSGLLYAECSTSVELNP